MINLKTIKLCVILFAMLLAKSGISQTNISYIGDSTKIEGFIFNENLSVEIDRQYYLSGESILFSCYTYDYILQSKIEISKIVYVEVFTQDNIIIKQLKIEMQNGLGNGMIEIPKSLPSGIYHYRVYTNYMKNFGCKNFYQNSVTILNPFIHLSENLESNETELLNDCKIYPEGGNIVLNNPNNITIIFPNYNSSSILAKVTNSIDTIITTFKTNKYGIGSFNITPEKGEKYKITAINNISKFEQDINIYEKSISLAYLKSSKDSIIFQIRKNNYSNFPLYLTAKYKNSFFNIAKIHENDSRIAINKDKLPLGLVLIQLSTYKNSSPISQRWIINENSRNQSIKIETNKNEYHSREPIEISITNKKEHSDIKYSLSVFNTTESISQHSIKSEKLNDLKNELYPHLSSLTIPVNEIMSDSLLLDNILISIGKDSIATNSKNTTYNSLKYLPEIEGDIINGQSTIGKTKKSERTIVTQSFVDSICHIQTTLTDSNGIFYFRIDNNRQNSEIVLTLNDTNSLALQDEFYNEFYSLPKEPYFIEKAYTDFIKQRMRNLQITDLYEENISINYKRNDTIPFYINYDKQLLVDEYPIFTTFEEFVFEVFPWVVITNTNKTKAIRVSFKGTDRIIGEHPLFLVDGIPVFDSDVIMSLKCNKLHSASVVYNKVFYQNTFYDGVIDIKTKSKNSDALVVSDNIIKSDYIGVSKDNYRKPKNITKKEIPYFESLLHWSPFKDIKTEQIQKTEIMAPDYKGQFLIKCCILNDDGTKEYFFESFSVK